MTNKSVKDKPQISLFSRIQTSNSSIAKDSPRRNVIGKKSPTNIHRSAFPIKMNSREVSVNNFSSGNLAIDVKRASSAPLKSNSNEEKTMIRMENITKSNSFEDRSAVSIGELNTPKLTSLSDESNNQSTELYKIDETPYKAFQIPSTNRLGSTHRSILSSNTNKKCRSAMENEFRSQKILFTTPSAVTRPAIQVISNFGLDDSLQCYNSASPVIRNQNQERQPLVKIKDPVKSIKNGNAINDDEAIINAASTITSQDETKILRINGKEFLIRKKIGQGGSSSVFLAEHKDSKLECAVKVVDLRGDPALIEGYVKEVKILASLQDKMNVIRLYE